MTKVSTMDDETIESHRARLRQYASILADFHEVLISERIPADTAKDILVTWWENELTWEGQ